MRTKMMMIAISHVSTYYTDNKCFFYHYIKWGSISAQRNVWICLKNVTMHTDSKYKRKISFDNFNLIYSHT